MAVRVAVELNLFNYIAEAAKDGRSITADELAKKSGAEQLLVGEWFLPNSTRGTWFYHETQVTFFIINRQFWNEINRTMTGYSPHNARSYRFRFRKARRCGNLQQHTFDHPHDSFNFSSGFNLSVSASTINIEIFCSKIDPCNHVPLATILA